MNSIDADSSDTSPTLRGRSLAWKTRLDKDFPVRETSILSRQQHGLSIDGGAAERKLGESRRTKRQDNASGSSGDIGALMDNHFFFNETLRRGRSNMPDVVSEQETRFARTMEWLGEATKASSPASSVRSNSAAPIPSVTARDALSSSKHTSSYQADPTSFHLLSNTDLGPASVSRDSRSSSFRKRSSSAAIIRGDIHSSSVRYSKADPDVARSTISRSRGSERPPSGTNGHRNSKSNPSSPTRTSSIAIDHGPSAQCRLPCQSCGNGFASVAQTKVHPMTDREHCYLSNNSADTVSYGNRSSAGPAGMQNKNDRSSRSAHPTELAEIAGLGTASLDSRKLPLIKTHPNNENYGAVQANNTEQRSKLHHSVSTKESTKESKKPSSGTGATLQNWFSKLIGKNTKAGKSSRLALPPPQSLAPGTTMQDVLNNKANTASAQKSTVQIQRPAVTEASRASLRQSVQAPRSRPSDDQNSVMGRSTSTANQNASADRFNVSESVEQEYARRRPSGPSGRLVDDGRFSSGSRSERRQRPAPASQQTLQHSDGRLQRYSPERQDRLGQVQRMSRAEISSPVDRQRQAARLDDDSRHISGASRSRRFATPNDDSRYISTGNRSQRFAAPNDDPKHISTGSRSQRFAAPNDDPKHVSTGSRSQRFTAPKPTREEPHRFISSSARNSPTGDTLVSRQTATMQDGERGQRKSRPSTPPTEDRDIDVLNDFLVQQRNNMADCANGSNSRWHLILSNSGLSSMLSAICYAWILQKSRTETDGWNRIPVMNITRRSMWNHKQLAWLFEQAGLDTRALLFSDELDLEAVIQDGEYRVSTIGHDVICQRGEVASPCTLVAETFFKEIEPSSRAKCIRILLLAGVLIDTENLDSFNVFCTKRDEVAASLLLPGAGFKGRAVLLAELKQKHESQEFYDMMYESYGKQHISEADFLLEAEKYLHRERKDTKLYGRDIAGWTADTLDRYFTNTSHSDFLSGETSPAFTRTKSSKSSSSGSTISSGRPENSKLSPCSPRTLLSSSAPTERFMARKRRGRSDPDI